MAIEKIKDCLNEKKCFYLKAAAGSGKTYTLIQSLKYILENKKELLKSKSIACITYTNIAKKEISERIDFHEQIEVYTIHEFFWKLIKNYQKELKKIIELKLDTDEKRDIFKNIKKIEYKEYKKYEKGIISHNDILIISKELFENYGNKLSKIVSSKYNYIFVDEYQDTDKKILDILCNKLSLTDTLIGLFGDPVQKIYRGELYDIENHCNFVEIKKKENHRSGKKIVELLNKLREDINQEAKKDFLGNIKFYYNPKNVCIDTFLERDFDGENLIERKKLYLVHRRIAKENNYEEFFEILDREKQIEYFTDNSKNRENSLANYLYLIEDCCYYFINDQAQKILKALNYKIFRNEDKKILREFFIQLIGMRENKTIKEVIDFIKDKEVIESLDIDENNLKLYNIVEKLSYSNIINVHSIYKHENKTIRTQHSTKGEEYESVEVCIIDKTDWNLYNFENYFLKKSDSNYERVKNLFYVACSRAQKNLIVNFSVDLSEEALNNIKVLFGEENFKILNL